MLKGKMEVLTDPDYCVLKFTAKSGRYYEFFTGFNFKYKGPAHWIYAVFKK